MAKKKPLPSNKFARFLNLNYYFCYRFMCRVGGYIGVFTHFILKPFGLLLLKIPFVKNR